MDITLEQNCPECGASLIDVVIDEITIKIEYDDSYYPDYLKTEYDEGKQEIIESMRYSNEDIKSEGWEKIKEWIDEDNKRLKDFEHNEWIARGVKATARVKYHTGNNNYRLEWLSSDGLWGIESDCGEEYLQEVIDGELEGLRTHLEIFNVNLHNFDEKAKKAKENIKENY